MPHGVRSTYSNITCTRHRATQGAANVVENHGRITGIGFFSHAVAETNDDLAALIGAEHSVDGPGLLLPLRNTELLRWHLERGTHDESHDHRAVPEPQAPYLASIGY